VAETAIAPVYFLQAVLGGGADRAKVPNGMLVTTNRRTPHLLPSKRIDFVSIPMNLSTAIFTTAVDFQNPRLSGRTRPFPTLLQNAH
jgi:hypothetical protein